ncbi:hypothetical protein HDR59_02185 [bacterium]|nr:hypothetical protein [bacterium]
MKKIFLIGFVLSACSVFSGNDELKTVIAKNDDGIVSHITKKDKNGNVKYRYDYKDNIVIEENFFDNGKAERVYYLQSFDGSENAFLKASADYTFGDIAGFKVHNYKNNELTFYNAYKDGEKCELVLKGDDTYYIGDEKQTDGHFVVYGADDKKILEFTLLDGKYDGEFYQVLFSFSNNPNDVKFEKKDMSYYTKKEHWNEYYFDLLSAKDKAYNVKIVSDAVFKNGELDKQTAYLVGGKWHLRIIATGSWGTQLDYVDMGPFFYPVSEEHKIITFDRFEMNCSKANDVCNIKYYLDDIPVSQIKDIYGRGVYGSPFTFVKHLYSNQ